MIEVSVPKDILQYEAKLIGPLSTRETICSAIAGVAGFLVYKLCSGVVSVDTMGYIICLCCLPFLVIGWVKPYGIPCEKFLYIVFTTMFLQPRIRKYQIRNTWEEEMFYEIEQEKKENKKKPKKKSKGKTKPSKTEKTPAS